MSKKTYSFKNIKEYLLKFSIVCDSNLQDSEVFTNLNSISESNKNDLIFFNDRRYLDLLKINKAKACLISSDNKDFLPPKCEPIIVEDPYLAFTHLTNLFFKQIQSNGIISKFVDLSKKTTIKPNVQINNFSTIKENVFLDKNVVIGENCVIGPNVSIGKNTLIGPNTIIANTKIGNYCIIKSNL